MGLPSKLKNMNLFNEGASYLGIVGEVTIPKLERDFEEWRGGGMIGAVKWDKGQKPIDFEWKVGGFMRQIFSQWGAATVDAYGLRFVGAYQRDDNGSWDAVEIIVRGRHEEIDPGKGKAGDDTEISVKTACAYYRLDLNGEPLIEIDFVSGIMIVDGVDRTAELREILGII